MRNNIFFLWELQERDYPENKPYPLYYVFNEFNTELTSPEGAD